MHNPRSSNQAPATTTSLSSWKSYIYIYICIHTRTRTYIYKHEPRKQNTLSLSMNSWLFNFIGILIFFSKEKKEIPRQGGLGCHPQQMAVSENSGTPQIIHFNRVFHYKPSILGETPLFWKHPNPLKNRLGFFIARFTFLTGTEFSPHGLRLREVGTWTPDSFLPNKMGRVVFCGLFVKRGWLGDDLLGI